MSNPTIRVQLEVNWDAGTDSIDDDRQIRVEVEYPNDPKAQLPDSVARRLADFVGALALPEGTGPHAQAAKSNAATAEAIREHASARADGRYGVQL